MKRTFCLALVTLMLFTLTMAYADDTDMDLGVQIIVGNANLNAPPFYAGNEIEMTTVTEEISEIFTKEKQTQVRMEEEALDYYLTAGGALGEADYVVFSDGRIALMRKGCHIIYCEFVSADVVRPKAILMDVLSNLFSYTGSFYEEYFFAFQDGFVFVDAAPPYAQNGYDVYFYNIKENCIKSFQAVSLTASLNESLYVFTDTQGRLVYFDVKNDKCGILSFHHQMYRTIYASKKNKLICRGANSNYYFIDFMEKKAYVTQLPQNTIYVDENAYVTNEEFSIKIHSSSSTDTLLKKANYASLQSDNPQFRQYGNVLSMPNETFYTINDGQAEYGGKSYNFISSMDDVHRFAAGGNTINEFHTQFYDKRRGKFLDVAQLPKEFKTESVLPLGNWALFYNPEALVFTPMALLSNNFYLLQSIGYYVYNVDAASGTYITVRLN